MQTIGARFSHGMLSLDKRRVRRKACLSPVAASFWDGCDVEVGGGDGHGRAALGVSASGQPVWLDIAIR